MSNEYDNLPEIKDKIIDWDEVGQIICGTYVGKSEEISTKYGTNFLYEIQTDEGKIVKFWGRRIINDKMKYFKFGTKVKIEYVASHPSKMGNDFKEIKIYGDPSIVNEEWLQSNSEDTPEQSEQEQPFLTETEKTEVMNKITGLGIVKLGVEDIEKIKEKVQEMTGLAFIDSNLQKIVKAMEEMPDQK